MNTRQREGVLDMNVMWIPVISIAGGIAMIIILALAGARTRQHNAELRAQVQMKLIDRFGSANEFIDFIQSPEGKQFLGDAPRVARTKFLGGLRVGIVLGTIGVAFLLLAFIEDRDWYIPAFIMLGIGGGFFLASFFSMKIAHQMENAPDPERSIVGP